MWNRNFRLTELKNSCKIKYHIYHNVNGGGIRLNLDQLLFDRLRSATQMVRGAMQGMGETEGSGSAEHTRRNYRDLVLAFLMEQPENVRQKDIARRIRVTPSTLSAMLDRLESDGYLTRGQDAQDKRVLVLTLTPAGRQRAQEVIEEHRQKFRRAFGNLTENEKKTLICLLEKLVGNL